MGNKGVFSFFFFNDSQSNTFLIRGYKNKIIHIQPSFNLEKNIQSDYFIVFDRYLTKQQQYCLSNLHS